MTPLSIPLAAAAMSVGAIQMGETSDKARAEEDGRGWGLVEGPPDRFLRALRRAISRCFYFPTLRM